MTRAEKVIRFVLEFCKVPEGELVGQNVVLADFQERFIRAVYDENVSVRKAILSIARKNSKTSTMAFLILAHLVGPEARQNTQIVSGAMSREQASIVFDLACKVINLDQRLKNIIKIIHSKKMLIGLPMNVTYQALAAEGKTAQGLSPVFALIDEAGQIVGPRSEFVEAISSSMGAHKDPLLCYISTQAANDSDYLSIIIDDALTSKDPKIVCHLYSADNDCDLMDEEQWKKANPAMGLFRSIDDIREQAIQASRMPSAESAFRNLILNQRVSLNSPFISKNAWLACADKPCPIEECEQLFGGLDLSGKTDLTSLVLYGLKDGLWNAYPYFWTPAVGLLERAKRDRAPYDVWVKQGLIFTTPSATVDYDFVAQQIFEITAPLNITAIAYDRWRIDILKKEFERLGLELPLVEWGQGFKDMSPALDAIEGKILNATLRHGGNPVLTMCANNSMLTKNPAGDRKLEKMKSSGRIDGMVALAMAAGIAEREHDKQGTFEQFLNNPLVL